MADPAAIEDHDGLEELREIVDLVRRGDDRAVRWERREALPERRALRGIQPDGRLIEEDDLGLVDEHLGETHPAKLSAGEL